MRHRRALKGGFRRKPWVALGRGPGGLMRSLRRALALWEAGFGESLGCLRQGWNTLRGECSPGKDEP